MADVGLAVVVVVVVVVLPLPNKIIVGGQVVDDLGKAPLLRIREAITSLCLPLLTSKAKDNEEALDCQKRQVRRTFIDQATPYYRN